MTTSQNRLPLTVNEAVEAKILAWFAAGAEQQKEEQKHQQGLADAQRAQQKDVYNTVFWDVAH